MWTKPEIKHNEDTKWGWRVLYPENLILGENTDIGFGTLIAAHDVVSIGEGTQVGAHCCIYSKDSEGGYEMPVFIGKNVRIGAHTVIMPGVKIDDNVILGACSFVPHNKHVTVGTWFGQPIEKKVNVWAVTGGTGSIGRVIVEELCKDEAIDAIRVISRDEAKQAEMKAELNNLKLRYIQADIRDADALALAFRGVHTVIHAAALKRVESCEYNPDEALKTNAVGSMKVAAACFRTSVKRCLLVSTDKAVSPTTVMGATKLAAEKMYLAYNNWSKHTRFWVVRLGNVWGSRGSVIPTWIKEKESGTITVTDRNMTRFFMMKQEVSDFVLATLLEEPGLHVPRGCHKICMGDLADAFCEIYNVEQKVVGRRPSEKTHEDLLTGDEATRLDWVEGDYKSNWGITTGKDELKRMLDKGVGL